MDVETSGSISEATGVRRTTLHKARNNEFAVARNFWISRSIRSTRSHPHSFLALHGPRFLPSSPIPLSFPFLPPPFLSLHGGRRGGAAQLAEGRRWDPRRRRRALASPPVGWRWGGGAAGRGRICGGAAPPSGSAALVAGRRRRRCQVVFFLFSLFFII